MKKVIAICLIWQATVLLFKPDPFIFPSPIQVFKVFLNQESVLLIIKHASSTLAITLFGLLGGLAFSLFTSTLLHFSPKIHEWMYPMLIFTQNIPIMVLGPLFIFWFGYGMLPKILLVILVCFFPITVSLLDGFKHTEKNLMEYFKTLGATKKEIFRYIEIPSALPYLFVGLRISSTYALLSAVMAEWMGSDRGLGIFIRLSANSYMTDRIFAATFIVISMSILFVFVCSQLQKFFLKGYKDGFKS